MDFTSSPGRSKPIARQHCRLDDDVLRALASTGLTNFRQFEEMMRAMERHERGEARVIPVILRPCDWHGAPFGMLMAVPPDGKPVVRHATLDDGFLEVAKAIRQVAGPAHPRAPAARASQPAVGLDRPATPGPRSSNLRVRGEFTRTVLAIS